MKYTIQTGINNPILRAISEEIKEINDELKDFLLILRRAMWENDGVGLAAPQIGKNIRVIATTQREKKSGKKNKLLGETIMINPVLKELSKEMIIAEEACLSVPDVFGKVKRHKSVVVHYTDPKWNVQKKKLKDFNATIVQHEIDHLDGVLFVDKLVKPAKRFSEEKKR